MKKIVAMILCLAMCSVAAMAEGTMDIVPTEEMNAVTGLPAETPVPAETLTPEEALSPEQTLAPAETGSPAEKADEGTPVSDETRSVEVRVVLDEDGTAHYGDEIVLAAILRGYEGERVTYQWEMSEDGGQSWIPVQGATDAQFTFVCTEATDQLYWRVTVETVEESASGALPSAESGE